MKKFKIPRFRVQLVRERSVHYRAQTPNSAAEIIRQMTVRERGDRESLVVLYLDGQLNVVGTEMVGLGGGHALAVTAKDIIRGAVVAAASGMILGHNHPSGDPTPSDADISMTQAVDRACDAVGIVLADHVVVTSEAHVSMREAGIL